MAKLIDTHVHLEQMEDIKAAIRDAKEAGVCAIITVGVDLKSSKQALKMSADIKDIKIYPAIGIHPSDCEKGETDSIIKLIEQEKNNIVAIGEIGLDFWYKQARKEGQSRTLQIETFKRQVETAKKINKPVIIHSRAAWRECFDITKDFGIEKALFHWYSGPLDVLEDIIKTGYFISATPSAEYSREHQAAIKNTPVEKLLVETDSPVRFKPACGEYMSGPKDIGRAVCAVARIKNMPEGQIAQQTTENAVKFFNLDNFFVIYYHNAV